MVLPWLLAALLGVGFVGLLVVHARHGRPWLEQGDTYTLRHSAWLRWFALIALFGGESLFAAWLLIAPPRSGAWMAGLAIAAISLGVLGFALVWEAFQWRLTASAAGLTCHSPWRPKITAAWHEIAGFSWSARHGWFIIHFADGRNFRVPAIVPGVSQLLATIAARSDRTLKRKSHHS